MEKLFLILLCAASLSCKKSADRSKPAAAPLTFADLESIAPAEFDGLPRMMAVPTPEIEQLSAYYQDEGNTRSGHVNLTLLKDPAKIVKYYEGRFPERATVAGNTVYHRHWTPVRAPETAEACTVLSNRLAVCVDIAPGVLADGPRLLGTLPLAELAERAAAKK